MRILFTTLITATVIAIEVLDNPQLFQKAFLTAQEVFSSAAYKKEVRIAGLSALTRSEIESLLPQHRATSWWMANFPTIQGRLEEHPWIKRAVVESCPGNTISGWGCFILTITERTPKYLANVDSEEWLLAEDGAFLLPLSTVVGKAGLRNDQRLSVDVRTITKVAGLASRLNSPDMLGAQMELVRRVVQLAPPIVERSVEEIVFEQGSDFSVRFSGVPFPVVFSSGLEGPTLSDQSERCALLLKKFSDRYQDIEKVDLAFEKVGVVKLKQ
jgi:hypothetical protein